MAGLLRLDFDGEDLRLDWWSSLPMRSRPGGGDVEVVEVEVRRSVGLNVGSWNVVAGAIAAVV